MKNNYPLYSISRIRSPVNLTGILLLVLALGSGAGRNTAAMEESFEPHPVLAGLPDNTALDLGRYECESRVPGLNCRTIFAYSRINYDPYMHRILVFGGGHAATGRTDVDVFDLGSLTWNSLYPSMSCEEVAKGHIDPRGFHRSTGHPAARHTYDQNVIVEIDGRGYLMMFSNEGFAGRCHPYKAPIRSVLSLPLDGSTTWEFGPEFALPWRYSMPAEFDPVSGMVILFGGRPRDPGRLWVYDPANHEIVNTLDTIPNPRNASNLLYYPPGDRMYLIDRESMAIREIALNREDWTATTARMIETEGVSPPPMRNFAYDSHNRIIGGVSDGVFHAFDPATRTWHMETMSACSEDGAEIGSVYHHAIDYDPVNNVFVFVTDRASGLRTWAYRYRAVKGGTRSTSQPYEAQCN